MSITDFMPFLLRIAASVIVKDAKSAYIRSPFCLAKIDEVTGFDIQQCRRWTKASSPERYNFVIGKLLGPEVLLSITCRYLVSIHFVTGTFAGGPEVRCSCKGRRNLTPASKAQECRLSRRDFF